MEWNTVFSQTFIVKWGASSHFPHNQVTRLKYVKYRLKIGLRRLLDNRYSSSRQVVNDF